VFLASPVPIDQTARRSWADKMVDPAGSFAALSFLTSLLVVRLPDPRLAIVPHSMQDSGSSVR